LIESSQIRGGVLALTGADSDHFANGGCEPGGEIDAMRQYRFADGYDGSELILFVTPFAGLAFADTAGVPIDEDLTALRQWCMEVSELPAVKQRPARTPKPTIHVAWASGACSNPFWETGSGRIISIRPCVP